MAAAPSATPSRVTFVHGTWPWYCHRQAPRSRNMTPTKDWAGRRKVKVSGGGKGPGGGVRNGYGGTREPPMLNAQSSNRPILRSSNPLGGGALPRVTKAREGGLRTPERS